MQSICVYDKVVTYFGEYTCMESGRNNKVAKSHFKRRIVF